MLWQCRKIIACIDTDSKWGSCALTRNSYKQSKAKQLALNYTRFIAEKWNVAFTEEEEKLVIKLKTNPPTEETDPPKEGDKKETDPPKEDDKKKKKGTKRNGSTLPKCKEEKI